MLSASRETVLAQAFRDACELDVRALKPGNVGLHGEGHEMTVADFLASAEAAAGPLTAPWLTVGERILGAVEATRRAVGCNTNLGIVLLCAPLLQAALQARCGETLRLALSRTLSGLDVEDARLAYRAIRIANPGGLGESARHDVRDEPRVSLLVAMREACERDSIARQYANGYADVLDRGIPAARRYGALWDSADWAATAVFMSWLDWLPDSHIARQHGMRTAAAVSETAGTLRARLDDPASAESLRRTLKHWDRELKRAAVNPGTSADLTVATLLAARADDALQYEFTDAEPRSGSRSKPKVGDHPTNPATC